MEERLAAEVLAIVCETRRFGEERLLFAGDIRFTDSHPFLADGDMPAAEVVHSGAESTVVEVFAHYS